MAGLFDDAPIAIPCPECGHKTERTVGQFKREPKFVCAACGRRIHLELEKLDRAEREVIETLNDVIRDVNRSLRRGP